RGGISDYIPIDLIMEISSRLPAKSIARFHCLFLTWSRAHPRLLFALERDDEWSIFSSPQLKNPYGKKSSFLTLYADLHVKFSEDVSPLDFCGLISGLIYFSTITRQYASLPKRRTDEWSRIFLGFDPIDKKFKVLFLACPRFLGDDDEILALKHNVDILTLGTRKMRNTLQHVEIQGFREYYEACDWNCHRVVAYVDYVEDLNVIDAK
ncbi:hypothetical protein EUTSA_v10009854mg, partial [Eutrema salsugineum]